MTQKRDWSSCLLKVLNCYNTHQSTGESPFSLMFGREPNLPVDFLLGKVQDPVLGIMHDWVVEHQTRLKLAFGRVKDRLVVAAGHRKECPQSLQWTVIECISTTHQAAGFVSFCFVLFAVLFEL